MNVEASSWLVVSVFRRIHRPCRCRPSEDVFDAFRDRVEGAMGRIQGEQAPQADGFLTVERRVQNFCGKNVEAPTGQLQRITRMRLAIVEDAKDVNLGLAFALPLVLDGLGIPFLGGGNAESDVRVSFLTPVLAAGRGFDLNLRVGRTAQVEGTPNISGWRVGAQSFRHDELGDRAPGCVQQQVGKAPSPKGAHGKGERDTIFRKWRIGIHRFGIRHGSNWTR